MNEIDKISVLKNSYNYFLEHVLIIRYSDYYRLLVINEWKLLMDRRYTSLKGARIAFLKFYQNRCWKVELEPEWSEFYDPGAECLNEISHKIET